MADRNQLEIDEIDALLGDDERRRRPAIGVPEPTPSLGPSVPDPPVPPSIPPGPAPESFNREEPSIDPFSPVVPGSRDGAHTTSLVPALTPPTGVLAPPPPAPEPTAPPPPPQTPPPSTAPPTSGDTSRPAGSGGSPNDAYADFTSRVDPNASQGDMESAIEASFGHLPGYGGAYKESVMLNGVWYDLVGGYGGPNASFHGMMAKTGGGGGVGMLGMMGELGGLGGLGGLPGLTDESALPAIMASIDSMARGQDSPLLKQELDELLSEASPALAAQIAPMLQQESRRPRARRPQPTVPEGGV